MLLTIWFLQMTSPVDISLLFVSLECASPSDVISISLFQFVKRG